MSQHNLVSAQISNVCKTRHVALKCHSIHCMYQKLLIHKGKILRQRAKLLVTGLWIGKNQNGIKFSLYVAYTRRKFYVDRLL